MPQHQGPTTPFLQEQSTPFQSGPQPATPAPTPPPSPKPKKQQYQTDQNRPFLFPFSKHNSRHVPFAIDEADLLYNKHIHMSLALAQMWKTREDCMIAESGLDHLPGHEGEYKFSTFNAEARTVRCISYSYRYVRRTLCRIQRILNCFQTQNYLSEKSLKPRK